MSAGETLEKISILGAPHYCVMIKFVNYLFADEDVELNSLCECNMVNTVMTNLFVALQNPMTWDQCENNTRFT